MGKHSGTTSGGNYIDFHTMKGTYTVLEHDDPAIMSSASYGLAATDPGGYAPEKIYYATKISTDGIYLHYLDTIYAQDNGVDVSHGCLNLNHSNAVWFYKNSLIGDPVQISGTGGPTIDVAQGGDWSVPWSTWTTGRITNS
jgi:lipoprotein-anchoring transpeptidase ErfK/SrfK